MQYFQWIHNVCAVDGRVAVLKVLIHLALSDPQNKILDGGKNKKEEEEKEKQGGRRSESAVGEGRAPTIKSRNEISVVVNGTNSCRSGADFYEIRRVAAKQC